VNENVLTPQLGIGLSEDGFAVSIASTGPDALMHLNSSAFDAIVLDATLPAVDGHSVLTQTRAEGIETAVIFLAKDTTRTSRIRALDAGADDCLSQDFALDELRARLRAHVRRQSRQLATSYKSGDIVFDARMNRVLRDGHTVTLTVHEMAVLSYLFHNSDRLVSRDELSTHIYQEVSDRGSNTIAVFVNRLRRKLGNDLIETVRGRGYVIKASV